MKLDKEINSWDFSINFGNISTILVNIGKDNQMIFAIVLTFLLILTLLGVNYCWLRPRRLMKFYENQLKNMKYNAKIMPYNILYNRFLTPTLEGKNIGDPFLEYRVDYSKYDIVVSNILNTPCIEFGHLDFLKDFYSTDRHYEYPKLSLLVDPFLRTLGQTIFLTQGKIWKQKKSLLNKIFNFEFVKMQIPNIVQICDRRIRQMEEKAQKGSDESGNYVQCSLLYGLMMKIFSSVIITGFIGLKDREQIDGIQVTDYFVSLFDDLGEHRLMSPTVMLGNRFFDLQLRKIDKSINQRNKKARQWGQKVLQRELKKIEKQKKQNGEKFIVDNVFKAYVMYMEQNNISEKILSTKDIFAEFFGFIFAGTDTTSNFLNGMICMIAKNPEIEKKLREQIQENIKSDEDYCFQTLKKLVYIDALQKQTIRIYGPANRLFARQAANDCYLNGLAIKKGTLVLANSYGNHYSEKYFKQPFKFRPQRWLNGQCDNLDPFVVIGFSAGGRTCIGKHLALLESKIALIKIMKRYKKISLGNQNFEWGMKFFVYPLQCNTKLTINQNVK